MGMLEYESSRLRRHVWQAHADAAAWKADYQAMLQTLDSDATEGSDYNSASDCDATEGSDYQVNDCDIGSSGYLPYPERYIDEPHYSSDEDVDVQQEEWMRMHDLRISE